VVKTYVAIIAAVVLLSLWLVNQKAPDETVRSSGAILEDVVLALYPDRDPDAQWIFIARELKQDPSSRESTVQFLESAERRVKGKVDLRLTAPSVTIQQNDNILAPYAKAEILKGCFEIALGREGLAPILIDQQSGFVAPEVRIDSPTVFGKAVDFRSDFKIEDISSGPGNIGIRPKDAKVSCKVRGGV
jgi:hypothetical protein